MVAAAAKSLQSCLTLCNPIDGSPPRSPVPGILQVRILEWVAISFSNACMHAKSLQSCLFLPSVQFSSVVTNLDSILKNRDISLPTNVCLSQGYGFSSGHVWM